MSDFTLEHREDHHRGAREALRGAVVMICAAAALVGVAFVVMQAVTGPQGWATRIAATAQAGDAVLLAGPMPDGMAD